MPLSGNKKKYILSELHYSVYVTLCIVSMSLYDDNKFWQNAHSIMINHDSVLFHVFEHRSHKSSKLFTQWILCYVSDVRSFHFKRNFFHYQAGNYGNIIIRRLIDFRYFLSLFFVTTVSRDST